MSILNVGVMHAPAPASRKAFAIPRDFSPRYSSFPPWQMFMKMMVVSLSLSSFFIVSTVSCSWGFSDSLILMYDCRGLVRVFPCPAMCISP